MTFSLSHFIQQHIDDDIHALALQAAKYPEIDMSFAIKQINGYQKVKSKVPLFYSNPDLLFPVQLSLEQSSSEATARYKASLCSGRILVDLTGGFGIDCFFMSDGFDCIHYVEQNVELCNIAEHNFKVLHKDNILIFNHKSDIHICELPFVSDWIYIDPARRDHAGNKVFNIRDCEPDIASLLPEILNKTDKLMIKLSPMIDIKAACRDLSHVAEIHIISVDNECKELLFIIDSKQLDNKVLLHCINMHKSGDTDHFSFYHQDQTEIGSKLTATLRKFLYEPNSSVMKSGGFDVITDQFECYKLHNNSHLYTSENELNYFPGRKFEIIRIWDNKDLKKISAEIAKANIAVRNYPLTVSEIRKKYKIKEGGNIYLFATTLANEQKLFIECIKC